MILISACLAGINCKYSGGNNANATIVRLYREGKCIAVCPEVLGGLPVPRVPAEIMNDRVITQDGRDVTENYERGAILALEEAKKHQCTFAVVKSNSPACGCKNVYDGTFSHTLVEADGIFTRKLKENSIKCITEKELEDFLDECL